MPPTRPAMKRSLSANTSFPGPSSPSKLTHSEKKLRIASSYSSESPYPTYPHPTAVEAHAIYTILANEHPQHVRSKTNPKATNNSAKTCGSSENVIDSLIGVILSQNTSGRNSSGAKTSLDAAFGRHNFAAIAESPTERVVEAIRQGGLANKKAATIQKLLTSIKERHGEYSLQYLAEQNMTDEEIMKELISYDGVGPKTASCVLLFCLGRDSFAVDTHVFRLSKLLGWVPAKADRVMAQAHLDRRIPDEVKYGLHVLMVQHGRVCKGCKKSGSKEPCVLKEYMKSTAAKAGHEGDDLPVKDDE
ncbi:base excision dna repair protein [Moniliophthora roreri MCA 2997]|uniref:Base excision dna repair protein n=2 Tax=Moniliophthora roreri TaxID=221103 RepID=V2X5H2_MONRO|nr:base excision dna repair protein [Moniliophthora roreri MCA 2997]KAI3606374.1 base excision dna repair protein [Moniliophthora roreri]